MPRNPHATVAYNALFQEPEILGDDTGQSCHVFALGSPLTPEDRRILNQRYENIGTAPALRRAAGEEPMPEGDALRAERDANMDEILQIRENEDTALPVGEMYLCGGFREGKTCPEHMWIEDRTNGVVYDTFINRHGIAMREGVPNYDQEFQPGSEHNPFYAGEIIRRQVDGYTRGQLIAISAGAEQHDAVSGIFMGKFPLSIAGTPPVVNAEAAANMAADMMLRGGRRAAQDVVARLYPQFAAPPLAAAAPPAAVAPPPAAAAPPPPDVSIFIEDSDSGHNSPDIPPDVSIFIEDSDSGHDSPDRGDAGFLDGLNRVSNAVSQWVGALSGALMRRTEADPDHIARLRGP